MKIYEPWFIIEFDKLQPTFKCLVFVELEPGFEPVTLMGVRMNIIFCTSDTFIM
jgi:hypothetical protein